MNAPSHLSTNNGKVRFQISWNGKQILGKYGTEAQAIAERDAFYAMNGVDPSVSRRSASVRYYPPKRAIVLAKVLKFTADELATLRAVQQRYGCKSASAAIRFALDYLHSLPVDDPENDTDARAAEQSI